MTEIVRNKKANAKKPVPRQESRVLSLRLPLDVYEKFSNRVKTSGMKEGTFLREVVLSDKTTVVVPDAKAIYHLNKTGNNINQLTKHLHEARKENKLNESSYIALLSQLELISANLKVIANVS